ncbi:MAG: 3-methyl-2-oxobutanoate hydroxymethyltransferase [SAR324 cluster bacterium]|nr:3-methyl-2-oxobutanoate hydroxymethyltransferase [SAR324 cluster bacterium]
MKKIGVPQIVQAKGNEKLLCLTAYDAFSATMVGQSDVHMILVGDSLGHVIQGKNTTIGVSMEHIIYHSGIVVQNAPEKFIIADMPFGSVGVSVEETVRHCMEVFKASGASAVKLEGTSPAILQAVPLLNDIGVPVMGHLGFRPQSVHVYGGYKVDGKSDTDRTRLMDEAAKLEEAGVFSIVLECVTEEVAQDVTKQLKIPTIGIGSGRFVDGQVLVFHDLLGMTTGKVPSFVRRYASLAESAREGIHKWLEDVQGGNYPAEKELYHLKK